jgi:hypothetical protein
MVSSSLAAKGSAKQRWSYGAGAKGEMRDAILLGVAWPV